MVNSNPFSTVLVFGRKKTETIAPTSPPEKPKRKLKLKGTIVDKYELAEGKLTFYAVQGFFKKRWIAVNEFPASDITNIDGIENGVSITWKDTTYSFLHRKKSESFSDLRDQILRLLAEQQQMKEKNQKESQLKADLTGVLNATLGTVDLTFDILLGLHEKRVNWQSLNAYADRLVDGVKWTGKTLQPLNLDVSKISHAIKKQVPKEVSREVLDVLKAVYGYFNSLPDQDDSNENSVLFENARKAIFNYLIFNDVLLARFTGQKDDPEELAALENALSKLNESDIKISLDEIAISVQKTSAPGNQVDVVDLRKFFREQIALL